MIARASDVSTDAGLLHPDPVENAILFGYIHLLFHLRQPNQFYYSMRVRAGRCKCCRDFIGPEDDVFPSGRPRKARS
jgi:hypothetical protein